MEKEAWMDGFLCHVISLIITIFLYSNEWNLELSLMNHETAQGVHSQGVESTGHVYLNPGSPSKSLHGLGTNSNNLEASINIQFLFLILHEIKCLELLPYLLTNSKLIFMTSHIRLMVNICWTKNIVGSYWKLIISKNGAVQSPIIQAKYTQPIAANFATHQITTV